MKTRTETLNPFPGLRPFRQDEDYLFFGREDQTLELLQRLGSQRLVAVVGTSGSGKSSLVRCGLLSELQGGKMLQAGTQWQIAVTHPGGDPLRLLTEGLLDAEVYDREEEDIRERLLATLVRSHFGLVEAVRQAGLTPGTNFLLVVDQFEEIFRFNEAGPHQREAAAEFVCLLLAAASQKNVPIYIVLTMRSDFIGDCAQFEGLAEAVNRGEFLIPRLTREQFKRVIEGPIKVAGGNITPRLLQRLLNDLGEQEDQLPCLQHALMRTWTVCAERAGLEAIDLQDYQRVGRMSQALSIHADEIYNALPNDRQRELCARLFKALTVRESDSRGIRRPQRLKRLAQITDVPAADLLPIIDAYRAHGVTFLMPSPEVELHDQTVIDISHESLMRVWVRLRHWVEEEAQSVRIYERLSESAALHLHDKAGLYRDPELGIAAAWRDAARPNAAWAEQCGGDYAEAMEYLDRSREAAEREAKERESARQRELERTREFAETQAKVARLFKRFAGSLALGLCLAVILTIWAFKLRSEANQLRTRAENQTQKTAEALETSKHEQGKGLLVMARGRLEQNDIFGAKMIAASAIGFSGFGREQQNATFCVTNLDLLRPGSNERGEVNRLLRGEPDFMRLWASPSVRHSPEAIVGLQVNPDGSTLISAGQDGNVRVWNLVNGDLFKEFRAHDAGLRKIDLSPEGRLLATASSDGTIKIWDASTWQQQHLLTNHAEALVMVRFSPDGKTLVSASVEGVLKVWDTSGFLEKPALEGSPITGVLRSLEVHPDGRFLLAGVRSGQRTWLWDLHTGKLIASNMNPVERSAAFSPDGRWLALIEKPGNTYAINLYKWELEAGVPRVTAAAQHEISGSFKFLVFSPDSQTLASAGDNGKIYRFSVPSLSELPPITAQWREIECLAFTPDGTGLLSAGGPAQVIRHFELPSGKPKWVPDSHAGGVTRAVFSPDGRLFVSAGADQDVRLWETATQRTQFLLAGHTNRVTDVIFRTDGALLASASDDGTIRLWDTATGVQQGVLSGHRRGVKSLAAHPSGQIFASGGEDGTVRIWSWEGNETHRINRRQAIRALAFSPDGRQLAFPQENEIELWDWAQKQVARPSLKGHATAVSSIAFSPDGALLASGGVNLAHGETRLWDLRSGSTVQRWYDDYIYFEALVAFTPDGRHLVRGLNTRIEWYEIGREQGITTRQLAVLNKRTYDPMQGIALSPDGRLLLTSHLRTGLELWDVSRGKESMEWSNPDGDAFCSWGADISPDGRLLATGTRNGFIRIWELATGRLLQTLKADETLRANIDSSVNLLNASSTAKDAVTGVRFSPDGQRLYTAYDRSGLITIWEFKDGWRQTASVANGQPVLQLALSPDGTMLATASYQAVRIWDAKNLGDRPLAKVNAGGAWPGSERPLGTSLAFHATGRRLAVGGDGIRVFDLTDPAAPQLVQRIPGNFKALRYRPDGKYLVGSEQFGPERFFDAETGKLVRSSRGPIDESRWACDFSPDGAWLAVGAEQKMVRLWHAETGEPAAVLRGHADWVNAVRFTPDGRRLVTVCSQTVRVWNVEQILHASEDYASYLENFRIEGEKVIRHSIESSDTSSITSTNFYRSVQHPLRAPSPHTVLGVLNRAVDPVERNRQLYWQYYRAQNLASAQAALGGLEATGQTRNEREALAVLCRTAARGYDIQNFPLALQHIEMALALTPEDVENWKSKAEILLQKRDLPSALSAIERAIQLSPQSAEAWAIKASALGRLSDEGAAAQAWAKAIDLASDRQKDTYVGMSQAGKPMPQIPDAQGWIRLFDGRTLSGWTAPDPSRWRMKDGELTGEGPRSHLFSPYVYTNLEFRADVKVVPGGNGGMFFRAAYKRGWSDLGYEAQVANMNWDPQKTGSLYNLHRVTDYFAEDDSWFTQHVVAIGNRIVIKVNDRIVTDFVDERNTYVSGHVALQQMGTSDASKNEPGAIITYRNVMVKPLPDDTQAAWAEVRKHMRELQ